MPLTEFMASARRQSVDSLRQRGGFNAKGVYAKVSHPSVKRKNSVRFQEIRLTDTLLLSIYLS